SLEKPKTVRSIAPIIEDWESDSEDENVFEPKEVKKTVKSSFEKIEFVNARNSTIEKPRNFSQNPRDNKRNRNGFERDFAPTSVLTKYDIVPISAPRQSSSRAAAPVSAARPINTAAPKPFVNIARPRPNAFHKTHSPSRIPFNQQTALKNRSLNDKVNTTKVNYVDTAKGNKVTSAVGEQGINVVKSSACWIWRPNGNVIDHISKDSGSYMPKRFDYVDPQGRLNGCSRHMTGNKFYLLDYQDIDGGFVAFGGSSKGGKITRKGKIRTGKLDFEDVYFVKELKFNLFSVSQMCDKKNNVLFTETECLVLSPDFKLLDEIDLTCLFAKATIDESNLWHRRLGHINFKTMNKLVRVNLVRVSMRSINRKSYCLVVTRFSWVFFLATKDETPEILKNFITGIENQSDHKVKTIRSDNGTEFKNRIMNEFCEMKGIRREFSIARTPQQNGVAERKNRTLIEAARTMLADSKLPTTFWAEAVNTACYVQNRVLVIKPHNKTPYELFLGRKPALSFMRPFGCPVTILNTLDHLENQTNGNAGTKENIKAGQAEMSVVPGPQYVLLPFLNFELNTVSSPVNVVSSSFTTVDPGRARDQRNEFESVFGQDKDGNSTHRMSTPVSAVESSFKNLEGSTLVNAATPSNVDYPIDPLMPDLEDTADLQDTGIFDNAYDDKDVGVEVDLNNLETTMNVSPIPTTRIHKDHPKEQIIGDINSSTQTRRMIKMCEEH
ncbi:ribonuclease H-like domain-containing protein, partial [Tanacetum coccineum]